MIDMLTSENEYLTSWIGRRLSSIKTFVLMIVEKPRICVPCSILSSHFVSFEWKMLIVQIVFHYIVLTSYSYGDPMTEETN